MNRRDFLSGTATLPWAASLWAQPSASGPAPRLLPRKTDPPNYEMDFATLETFLTPNDRFYIRNHYPTPQLDAETFRLRVEGAVEKPLTLSLADLRQLPRLTRVATLECAGNGREFLEPKVKGVPWKTGAVGNAEWSGFALTEVLKAAGVKDSAVEVVLEGADRGEVADPPSPGPISYARSVPLKGKTAPFVLLADQMNGQSLPPDHGFPLRGIVPGWYGMASVKWLVRLVVLDRPYRGYWQTLDYTHFVRVHGLPQLVPITRMEVKSLIARPSDGEVLMPGKETRLFGAAWTGTGVVDKVEVSTDGGRTWTSAQSLKKPVPNAWRLWEHPWKPAVEGDFTLMARATDSEGHTQPMTRNRDRRSYMISHVVPVKVRVGKPA